MRGMVNIVQEVAVQSHQRDTLFTQFNALPITQQLLVDYTQIRLRLQQFRNEKVCKGLLLVCFAIMKEVRLNLFMELLRSYLHTRHLK